MKRYLSALLISLVAVAPHSLVFAQKADPRKRPPVEKEQRIPIRIEADRLDALNEKRQVIFTGSVVAKQEDKTIKADRMILYYKKEAAAADKAPVTRDPLRGGDLERIEAKGKVIIILEERTATGDEAVFFQDSQEMILTGNATLREGDNTVSGHKVTVYLNENRGIVESGENRRVTATIFTTEGQGLKK